MIHSWQPLPVLGMFRVLWRCTGSLTRRLQFEWFDRIRRVNFRRTGRLGEMDGGCQVRAAFAFLFLLPGSAGAFEISMVLSWITD